MGDDGASAHGCSDPCRSCSDPYVVPMLGSSGFFTVVACLAKSRWMLSTESHELEQVLQWPSSSNLACFGRKFFSRDKAALHICNICMPLHVTMC